MKTRKRWWWCRRKKEISVRTAHCTCKASLSKFHYSHKSDVESLDCTEKCSLSTLLSLLLLLNAEQKCGFTRKKCARKLNLCNVFFAFHFMITTQLLQSREHRHGMAAVAEKNPHRSRVTTVENKHCRFSFRIENFRNDLLYYFRNVVQLLDRKRKNSNFVQDSRKCKVKEWNYRSKKQTVFKKWAVDQIRSHQVWLWPQKVFSFQFGQT